MKVANSKIGTFDSGLHEVYLMQRLQDEASEHDPRGLVGAVILSVTCWAILGYFLLG